LPMTSSWTGCNRLPQQQPKWPPEAACLSDQIPARTTKETLTNSVQRLAVKRKAAAEAVRSFG
jgi:hypothetical protein